MQVKTYSGTNSQAILARIKTELGADAVILDSRTFQKNGGKCTEITAGVERPLTGTEGTGKEGFLSSPVTPPGWGEWHKEWMRIKEQIFALMKPGLRLERLTPRQRVALEFLQREGIDDTVAVEVYQRLVANQDESVLAVLSNLVPVRGFTPENWPQPVHVLTGPFGAGKTTTALRMALHVRGIAPDTRVAFINADAMRGTGRLVLRHWAELSGFQYMEAADAESMRKALMVCSEKADMTFVDAPGLTGDGSFRKWQVRNGLEPVDTASYLVLEPHYGSAQMAAFLERYDGVGGIVWSKLDEAVMFGPLVNVAWAGRLPVVALSYGAGLKESLSPATESLVWRLIFKRQLPQGSVTQ